MSVLEIVILSAFALIIIGAIITFIYRKKHPKKEQDEDGEES